VNEILERANFDAYAERICRKYYAPTMGRPSIAPGVYFRCFLVGYFEGIDSERGIAYRFLHSLNLRELLGLSLKTHKAMFRWVLQQLARRLAERQESGGGHDHAGGQRGGRRLVQESG